MSARTEAADRELVCTRLEVEGMSCAACQSHVERALREVPGVTQASVSLMTHSAEVYHEAGASIDALVQSIEEAGYEARTADEAAAAPVDDRVEERTLRLRAAFTLLGGIVVMAVQLGLGHRLTGASLEVMHVCLLVVTLVGMICGAGTVYAAAWRAARHRSTNMNTLVALGTGAAFVASVAATFAPGFLTVHGLTGEVYYDAVLLILGFLLAGRWLDARAKRHTLNSLHQIMKLQPETARILRGGEEVVVPARTVQPEDILVVRPGERIPADGVIIDGGSTVDESIITGESRPVLRTAGDAVIGGSLNYDGLIRLRATGVGESSVLAQMLRLMEQAQSSKAPMQHLADRVSAVFVPAVLGLALLCFVVWALAGHDVSRALAIAISVLVIACPCAMGLAVPAAQTVATGRGARMGILFKGGESLERLARVDTLLLDKTGTITEGKPSVTGVFPAPGRTQAEVLAVAAAVEQHSEHPLAHGILMAAEQRGITGQAVSDVQALPGVGIQAKLDGRPIAVKTAVDGAASNGTRVDVWSAGERLGSIELEDTLRPGTVEAVRRLKGLGIRISLVTGDAERPALAMADQAGIESVIANCRPERKLEVVRERQATGDNVGMVGDGINDAAALAQANAGIAMGNGTDLAQEAGDVILLGGSPGQIADSLQLARATLRVMKQNLGWAFLYNVLGIPLAAGVLYPKFHILLNPAIASAAMALSSVSVLANSLRLQRFHPRSL